jgi:hypothetical protein
LRKFCAFDIEIAKGLAGGINNWRDYRPLGITCAATITGNGQPVIWYGKTEAGEPADKMRQAEAGELVAYLKGQVQAGYTLLSWNGLGFDFDVLAEESGLFAECHDLALKHVDLMFHVFCLRGHTLGLDKAAKGMRLPGKTAGLSGEMAPRYWAEGRRREILEYVAQDARTTLDVAEAAERIGELRWISDSGFIQRLPLAKGWLAVREALQLPEPDTTKFRNPLRRKDFLVWTRAVP